MEEEIKRDVYCPDEKDKRKNHIDLERVCKEIGLVEEDYKFEYEKKSYDYYDRIILPKEVCQEIKEVVKKGVSSFYDVIFSVDVNFYRAKFNGGANFTKAIFSGYANFNSAIFNGYANFDGATFSGYADFSRVTFSSRYANFNSAIFNGYSDFESATFSGEAYFSDVIFSRNAYFESATFSGCADFPEAKFEQYLYFDVDEVKYLKLDNISRKQEDDFLRITEDKIKNIKSGTRQTFRLLKHIALENHNKILGNKMLKKEMEAYHEELSKEMDDYIDNLKKQGNEIEKRYAEKFNEEYFWLKVFNKKWRENFGDRFILNFNRLSNNYGLSWGKGIVFTISTTMLLYFLSKTMSQDFIFICEKGFTWKGWEKFLVEYIDSLSPFKTYVEMFANVFSGENIEVNLGEKIFLLLETIFLVLGIFRINQAFRKLNDKG